MRRRRAKLRDVAGGNRKTYSQEPWVAVYNQHQLDAWFWYYALVRPYAAVVDRRLKPSVVDRLLEETPPWVIRKKDGMKIYLFKSGEDRDLFVETFHHRYHAKAIVAGVRHAS